MKKHHTWLLFVAYLAIFVAGGLVFYFKYLDSFLLPGAEPPKVDIVNQSQIYYTLPDGLYQANPNYTSTGALIDASNKISSMSQINSLDVVPEKFLAYSALNQAGHLEVIKTDFTGENPEVIGSTAKMSDFTDFNQPRFDPEAKKLAFIASSSQKDAIFIFDLASGTLSNATSTIETKIADFSWDTTGKKIVFCTKNAQDNYCEAIEVATGKNLGIFSADVSQIYWNKSAVIYYLGDASGTTNIFSLTDLTGKSVALTNIASPKTISSFSLSDAAKAIVYEVSEGDSSDIYTSMINGSNLIQLTQDTKSTQPLISPDGKLVAFLRVNDGIYLIGSDKLNDNKLLNLSDKNTKLQLWR